jgi:hypothetical protein
MNRRFVSGESGRATTNWNFFVGAAILVVGLLLKLGAPTPAIALGVALAAFWNWKRGGGAAS